jgi:hypothetical protein
MTSRDTSHHTASRSCVLPQSMLCFTVTIQQTNDSNSTPSCPTFFSLPHNTQSVESKTFEFPFISSRLASSLSRLGSSHFPSQCSATLTRQDKQHPLYDSTPALDSIRAHCEHTKVLATRTHKAHAHTHKFSGPTVATSAIHSASLPTTPHSPLCSFGLCTLSGTQSNSCHSKLAETVPHASLHCVALLCIASH